MKANKPQGMSDTFITFYGDEEKQQKYNATLCIFIVVFQYNFFKCKMRFEAS